MMPILAAHGQRVEEALLEWVRYEHPGARIADLTELAASVCRGGVDMRAEATNRLLRIMREAEVLYQVPLFNGRLFGIADFLVRRGPLTHEEAPPGCHGAAAFAV